MDTIGFIMMLGGIVCLLVATYIYWLAHELKESAVAFKQDAEKILDAAKETKSQVTQKIIDALGQRAQIEVADLADATYKGLPVDDDTPEAVLRSLKDHGFVFHWNRYALRNIGVNYVDPKNPQNEIMREVYALPIALAPANMLHDKAKAQAAFWAARQFKAEHADKTPELAQFAYL